MQIKQPYTLPSPPKQNLKGYAFATNFVKSGEMAIFRNAGWTTLKNLLTGDPLDRLISFHILNYKKSGKKFACVNSAEIK
jgi:hypothetical protein